MLDFLTLAERNTYSSANALSLLAAAIVIDGLAMTGRNIAIVLVVAVVAGLCLAAWSRLIYSLLYVGNRWIGPLVGLATVGLLLVAGTVAWPLLLGVAVLLFVCWLPFMAAESAGQALRVRAYWSNSPQLWRLARVAQIVIDTAVIGAIVVFLAVPWDGPVPMVRLAAMLVMAAPLLLSRAAERSGPLPSVLFWPTPGDRDEQAPQPADDPQQE